MLTDKLNTRREHESGTLLEDEWSNLVSDETLLEHLIFFARVSMHEMSRMFRIHGSGVISLNHIVSSHSSKIHHLSSKDAFESINFELWVLRLIYLSSNGKTFGD